ncbi:MAG: hypothetical protein AAB469_01985 [Patescibacteria group bacterium]
MKNELIKKYLNINTGLLVLVLFLFGFYIYQSVSISSGKVALINLKKEFLEKKNNLETETANLKKTAEFNPDSIRENLKMVEIEKFDYIIIGPSEFALTESDLNAERQ